MQDPYEDSYDDPEDPYGDRDQQQAAPQQRQPVYNGNNPPPPPANNYENDTTLSNHPGTNQNSSYAPSSSQGDKVWVKAHWKHTNDGWIWIEGYWKSNYN